MREPGLKSKFSAGIALTMGVIAFALGSAPFTPALVLALFAIPLAVSCLFLGAWRLSIAAIYWASAALTVIPLSRRLTLQLDESLILLGVAGFVLSSVLYVDYSRKRHDV